MVEVYLQPFEHPWGASEHHLQTDPITAGDTFDPGRYRWTVGYVSVSTISNIPFVTEAYHLLDMSLSPRTHPIAMTIGRLRTELEAQIYGPMRLMIDLRGTRPLGPAR